MQMLNSLAFETWKRASQNLISLYQLRLNRVISQSAKHLVALKSGRYEIETIRHPTDLYNSLKIRRDIEKLNHKLRMGLSEFALTDDFDAQADHILVRDTRTNYIVGGFRLLSTSHTSSFFNELIFNIDSIKNASASILELSRSYLLPEHNHPDLVLLAARFLSQYSMLARTDIIISNQSINSGASRSAALMNQYFESAGLKNYQFNCHVQLPYQIPNFQHWKNYFRSELNEKELLESVSLLPSVFKSSLSLGTTIAALPGLDRSTNRIDFLTILHKEDLNRSLWKKSLSRSELSIEFSSFLA